MDARLGGMTLTVAVDVMLELWSAVAVTVIVPIVEVEVTSPEEFIDAALGPPEVDGAIVQLTEVLPLLPSLNVPVACI